MILVFLLLARVEPARLLPPPPSSFLAIEPPMGVAPIVQAL